MLASIYSFCVGIWYILSVWSTFWTRRPGAISGIWPKFPPLSANLNKTRGDFGRGESLGFRTSKFPNWGPKTQKNRACGAKKRYFGVFRAPGGALHQKNRACGAIFFIFVDFWLSSPELNPYLDPKSPPLSANLNKTRGEFRKGGT